MSVESKFYNFLSGILEKRHIQKVEDESKEALLNTIIKELIPNGSEMIEFDKLALQIKNRFPNLDDNKELFKEILHELTNNSRLIVQRRGDQIFFTRKDFEVNEADLSDQDHFSGDSQRELDAILDQLISEGVIVKAVPIKLVDLINLIRIRYHLVGTNSEEPLKKIIDFILESNRIKVTQNFGQKMIELDVNDSSESEFWKKNNK